MDAVALRDVAARHQVCPYYLAQELTRWSDVVVGDYNYWFDGSAMLQPYLPAIETEGETSLLYFGGRLSHAVNKRPANGDFRIQVDFGGTYTAVPAPPGAVALAGQVLAAIDEPLLYARIDMVRDRDGHWLLMEAELIEPDFYLGQDPAAGAGFAQAAAQRLA